MAITINGTTGIAGVDGSAGTPAVQGADPNTGIFYPAADTIAFAEGGAEVARFDSSGNLGIGTSSPQAKFQVVGAANIQSGNRDAGGLGSSLTVGADANTTTLTNNTRKIGFVTVPHYTNATGKLFLIAGDADTSTNSIFIGGGYTGYTAATQVAFYTGATSTTTVGTERMRIDSSGNVGINTTTPAAPLHVRTTANNWTSYFYNSSASGNMYGPLFGFTRTPNDTNSIFLYCEDNTNAKCAIYSNGTVTNRTGTYNSFSDLKLKQDVFDANSQWNDIKDLRIVKYRLKDEVAADSNYPAYIGVIAQEVEQVSPGLVDNCPDFEEVEVVDEQGNITKERKPTGTFTKSVKSSIIYMKAVKALQEAMERIETLEAQNAAFEARLAALEAK
jgi:hypothetical protein